MYLVKNYKKTFIFFLGYFSLLIGFYLNENSSGGALPDFNHHYKVLLEFELNFFESILNYSKFNTDHSPVFIIILQAINLFFQDINFTRIAYLTIFSSTTIIFYNCLVLKYKNVNQDVLFFFSSILFISPNFRSLLIWPGSEIASLFFF